MLAYLLAHWYEVPYSKPVPEAMPERRSCARQVEAERRFALRQDKRREKHRGH